MREAWATAIGYEIENKRMMGKLTIFVYAEPSPDPQVGSPLIIEQIYFTQEYLINYGFEKVYRWIDRAEITLQIVPEFLAFIPDNLRTVCHFVVDIKAEKWFQYVKPTDTLKLTTGDWCAATVTIQDMLTTKKSDYMNDVCGYLKGEK